MSNLIGTNTIETESERQAQIIEKYYKEAMSAVNIKNENTCQRKQLATTHGNRLEKHNLYRIPSRSNFK
eukprot:226313-Pelagomonas_calceolata.AAC.1